MKKSKVKSQKLKVSTSCHSVASAEESRPKAARFTLPSVARSSPRKRGVRMTSRETLPFLYSLFFILLLLFPSFAFAENGLPNHKVENGEPLGNIEGPGGFIPDFSKKFTQEGGTGWVLEKAFSVTLGVFTLIGGLMLIIYFVLGALAWIAAGGQADKIQKAKDQMTNAVIGMVIVVGSYAFFYILSLVLGIKMLNPASVLVNLAP